MTNSYLKSAYWFCTVLVFSFVAGMFLAAWLIEVSSGFAYMGIPTWGYQLLVVSMVLLVLGGMVQGLRPNRKQALKLVLIIVVLTGLVTFGFIMLAGLVIGMLTE